MPNRRIAPDFRCAFTGSKDRNPLCAMSTLAKFKMLTLFKPGFCTQSFPEFGGVDIHGLKAMNKKLYEISYFGGDLRTRFHNVR